MTEQEFYEMIDKMLNEKRITKEEYDKVQDFVCAMYDYLDFEKDC